VLVRRQDHGDAARDRHAQVCHSQTAARDAASATHARPYPRMRVSARSSAFMHALKCEHPYPDMRAVTAVPIRPIRAASACCHGLRVCHGGGHVRRSISRGPFVHAICRTFANGMLRVARCLLHVACCMLHAARCILPVACCTLSVCTLPRCTLHVVCCILHVACCTLPVAYCMLSVARCLVAHCLLHAAYCPLHVARRPGRMPLRIRLPVSRSILRGLFVISRTLRTCARNPPHSNMVCACAFVCYMCVCVSVGVCVRRGGGEHPQVRQDRAYRVVPASYARSRAMPRGSSVGTVRRSVRRAVPQAALCCMLHAACCMLHVACCLLHAVRCMLPVARCLLHAVCCMLHVACRLLHVARWHGGMVACGAVRLEPLPRLRVSCSKPRCVFASTVSSPRCKRTVSARDARIDRRTPHPPACTRVRWAACGPPRSGCGEASRVSAPTWRSRAKLFRKRPETSGNFRRAPPATCYTSGSVRKLPETYAPPAGTSWSE
jgi:hypothetical protein